MFNFDNITESVNNKDWSYRNLIMVLLEVVKLIIY